MQFSPRLGFWNVNLAEVFPGPFLILLIYFCLPVKDSAETVPTAELTKTETKLCLNFPELLGFVESQLNYTRDQSAWFSTFQKRRKQNNDNARAITPQGRFQTKCRPTKSIKHVYTL